MSPHDLATRLRDEKPVTIDGHQAPPIVLLDEATALVIAHRLSTVREADSIVVLDRGRVVQRGAHDELLAAGELYAELYETQYATVR